MLLYDIKSNLTKDFRIQCSIADSGGCCPQCLPLSPGAQGEEMPWDCGAVLKGTLYLSGCGRGASVLEKLG